MELRVLELFSGIGGMHYALKSTQLPGCVVAAMDINTFANEVYAHNHVDTPVHNRNIQSLTARAIEKFGVNMLLMSPPCQPHTRVGHQLDMADHRSDALQHICTLLPECGTNLEYVLMENVKGFERSEARRHFVQALEKAGYYWREFILNPTQFGVPNTRHRYYCIARKKEDFGFAGGCVWEKWPLEKEVQPESQASVEAFLEPAATVSTEFNLPEKVLDKRVWLMDIVNTDATNTMCFTKAYTHYSEGTGSVYTPCSKIEIDDVFAQVKILEQEKQSTKKLQLLRNLRLRYFTPREVARLMSFPDTFSFPASITNRQRYRLLGNSLNVRVVSELINLLCA